MIPISDDNPQNSTPYGTYGIIALNIFAWFFIQGFGSNETLNSSVCEFGFIPGDVFGSGSGSEQVCRSHGSWLGIFSSMFMHGSWMHIIGNMWFLWIFGDNIEDSMGTARFIIFYLLCGVLACAAQAVSNLDSLIPMVGASGAIGGVMGAYIVLYPKVKVNMLVILFVIITTFRVPAIAMLGYWIVVQLIGGVSSMSATGGGTAFWAHVGGFAAGAALIWVFKDEELLTNHQHRGWKETENPADIWNDPDNRQ